MCFKFVRQIPTQQPTVSFATSSVNLFSRKRIYKPLSIKLFFKIANWRERWSARSFEDEYLLPSIGLLLAVGCLPDWYSYDSPTINYLNKFIRSSTDEIKSKEDENLGEKTRKCAKWTSWEKVFGTSNGHRKH